MEIKETSSCVEIHIKSQRIRVHQTGKWKGHRRTNPDDLPEILNLRDYEPINVLLYKSRLIGENTYYAIARILRKKPHPVVQYRRARSILFLAEEFDLSLLEEVIEELLIVDKATYLRIKQRCIFRKRFLNSSFGKPQMGVTLPV